MVVDGTGGGARSSFIFLFLSVLRSNQPGGSDNRPSFFHRTTTARQQHSQIFAYPSCQQASYRLIIATHCQINSYPALFNPAIAIQCPPTRPRSRARPHIPTSLLPPNGPALPKRRKKRTTSHPSKSGERRFENSLIGSPR